VTCPCETCVKQRARFTPKARRVRRVRRYLGGALLLGWLYGLSVLAPSCTAEASTTDDLVSELRMLRRAVEKIAERGCR
jgi:hypothetical protein